LVRTGQTEAVVDLARIAGMTPAGVICEVMNDDGTMSRLPHLREFASTHGIKMITVADLVSYRMSNEVLVHRAGESRVPTVYGEFNAVAYTNDINQDTHLALVMGEIDSEQSMPVRVHSQCVLGDVFGSLRDDTGWQLHRSLEVIAGEGHGVLLYLKQEGRGVGLVNQLKAYRLMDEQNKDTVEADEAVVGLHKMDPRDYGIGAQILHDLGVRKMRLITNHPVKRAAIEGFGLEITDRIPIEMEPNESNEKVLRTRKEKLGHLLTKV
jgi:3,4-dihydroxy 2-butanone 4-phosphate synthase/GTP cyclohydrolase II